MVTGSMGFLGKNRDHRDFKQGAKYGTPEGCLENMFSVVQGFLLRVTSVRFLIHGSLRCVVLGMSGVSICDMGLDFEPGYSVGLESRDASTIRFHGAGVCRRDLLWLLVMRSMMCGRGTWYGLVVRVRGCSNSLQR